MVSFYGNNTADFIISTSDIRFQRNKLIFLKTVNRLLEERKQWRIRLYTEQTQGERLDVER